MKKKLHLNNTQQTKTTVRLATSLTQQTDAMSMMWRLSGTGLYQSYVKKGKWSGHCLFTVQLCISQTSQQLYTKTQLDCTPPSAQPYLWRWWVFKFAACCDVKHLKFAEKCFVILCSLNSWINFHSEWNTEPATFVTMGSVSILLPVCLNKPDRNWGQTVLQSVSVFQLFCLFA